MKGLFQEDLCMSALADTRVLFISMCEVRYANVCYNAVFHQSQHAIATISINEKQQTTSLPSFRYKESLRVYNRISSITISSMSVHDKVKVLWKTNCQWRDRPLRPKRKEIKANSNDEGKELSSLKPGDVVRVKFGSRWYNVEVCESWKPKQSKKGIYVKH